MSATESPNLPGPVPTDPLLSIRGLSKSFGAVHVLTNVDLDVPRGQVTALCGDNGAGKSVLIKTIAGLWPPDSGRIIWEGREVHLHHPKAADALGIKTIYQDLALCDNLNIIQNIFLGHELLDHGLLDEPPMEIATREVIHDLHVNVGSVKQHVGSLSGGQRQTVAVARAVLSEAKLVIMDEPTAALGVTQTGVVLKLIKQLASNGVAVLVISHNLNDVFEVADRIAILHLGRMVAAGAAADFDRTTVVRYMSAGDLALHAPVATTNSRPLAYAENY